MEERPPTSDTLTATIMPLEFYPATASAPIPLPLELSLVDNRGQTTTIRVTVTLRTRLRWQSPRLEGAVRRAVQAPVISVLDYADASAKKMTK